MNFALAILTAVLLILTFPDFNLWFLAPLALAPLLVAVAREPHPPRRLLMGWFAGILYWSGVCYWIQYVLALYGGLGRATSWAAFLLFCLIKALHLAIFALLAGMLIRLSWAPPALAALWVAIEVTHGPLGFAWLTLGNAGASMGVPMRLAPITGVYGLSFVFALMAGALALAILRRPRRHLLWLAALIILPLLPKLPEPRRGSEEAVLVQPNISESQEWTPESLDNFEQRLELLSMRSAVLKGEPKPDLIVWPEVPAPFYFDRDPVFRQRASNLASESRAYFLLGVVAHTPEDEPLNSALLISPAGEPVSRYDKVNLVPFGEFVPWPFEFVKKISSEAGDFHAGEKVTVAAVGNHKIGTFICYESVFPNFVRRFVVNGAEVLFNISNDGYFGKSSARQQHLLIVRMRAAENRRWILRSTNDGITAAIDQSGRVIQQLPPYVQAAMRAGYSYIPEITIYTRWGDWFPAGCAVISLAALAAAKFPARWKRI